MKFFGVKMGSGVCKFWLLLTLSLSALVTLDAAAAPVVKVVRTAGQAEQVQGDQRSPLVAEATVDAGGEIHTGPDARATLRFDELMLTAGADSVLRVVDSEVLPGGRPPVLRVKLETGVLRVDGRPGRGKLKDLRLNVADIRLRVLGAEIWVATTDLQQTICLLSGAVELQSGRGEKRLDVEGNCLFLDSAGWRLDAPSELAIKARLSLTDYPSQGEAAPPELAVGSSVVGGQKPAESPELHRSLESAPRPSIIEPVISDPELSVSADRGPRAGGWTLVALALGDVESARLEALTFSEMGLPCQVRPHKAPDGRSLYRVTIGSFATRQQAQAYAELLKTRFGLNQLWAANY